MSKELVVKKDIAKEHELSVIEQVVMQGDLSKLNPLQRVTYYNKVCESMGLNPYTRPFDYISLNGKLTLYAKKDATEQLRQVKKISITSLEGRMVDDLYIVVAKATTPDGRLDQSTGAVSIGNLKGEQKANAIMKAETKAKRRVTLSISGMGWTDESEIESIPNARPVNVDMETGEVLEIHNPLQPPAQAQAPAQPPAPPVAPPAIEHKPIEGYAEFVAKHGLIKNSDGSMSKKMEYVTITSQKANMTEIQVVNAAIKNEKLFEERFDLWQAKKYPKPKSMDELAMELQE